MPGRATKAAITKARRVRDLAGIGLEGPVPDLLALAEDHCGAPVVILPELPADLAGAYIRPVIFVNGGDPVARMRFTLAHELGHHVFGDARQEDTHAGLVRPGHWIEVRANAFAAELLMPAPGVVAFAGSRAPDAQLVVDLATAFGTSLLASAIRLETAGLVDADGAALLREQLDGLEPGPREDSVAAARADLPRYPASAPA